MEAEPVTSPPVAPVSVDSRPRKRINNEADMQLFLESRLFQQLVSFVQELAASVKGVPMSPDRVEEASPLVQGLVSVLDQLERWVDEVPPIQQPMRFGNKAFKQWHERVVAEGEGLLRECFEQVPAAVSRQGGAEALASELAVYLQASFGDERRIDYGTGHEASFFAILFALGATNVASRKDAPDLVLVVFAKYMKVMRKLQTVYVLEPAGSHGVWGLDDFHALPFLLGAAQLDGHEAEVPTGSVFKEPIIKEYADSYLYVDAIRQILLSKTGAPFHETSPMLYDITAVENWQKTHNGLVKMWKAEVLSKKPVIQHFLFGEALPWPGDPPPATSGP